MCFAVDMVATETTIFVVSERFCVFVNELAAAETTIFVVFERFCVFAGEIAAAETTIFVVPKRFCVAFALPKKANYTYLAQSNLGQIVCHSRLIQFNFDQTVCQATSPQASSSIWIDENSTFLDLASMKITVS